MEREFSVGVDIGGTNYKVGVVDTAGRLLFQCKSPTDPASGVDSLLTRVIASVRQVLEQGGLLPSDIRSIGIGVPGTADAVSGVVHYAPNLFWRDVPVSGPVSEAFGTPVFIAQDTRAATWAEFLVGEGQGKRSVAGVTLGTGVGCGMVLDGKIFHGALNTAGEFGHQIVEYGGASCNCGRSGCLEAHAGGLAIVRQARERIDALRNHSADSQGAITVDDVYRLSVQGDVQARQLTDDVVRYVGIGLVNLINLNSIELVCLSGGISNAPADRLLNPLVAFVKTHVYEPISDRVRVCRSALGEDAPLIGAALLDRAIEKAASSIV